MEVRAARINCQTSTKTKSGPIIAQIAMKQTAAENATAREAFCLLPRTVKTIKSGGIQTR